ncbi:hypothetical protein [uncultured Dietzia sp.]|jgi:hypothetical protein|uniref:hypothetical protein n=1 Tax=uncultured Dietzia sp. TaxID=395519 RepID=UPI0026316FCB|nr:hypothetical protein [uncultured Dietzia sp.]HMT34177.1 hypothetical protein [Dermatophilaceae bacterium]
MVEEPFRIDARDLESDSAAHGFLEGRTALLASTFSGGAATVAAQLKSLGFVVSSERSPD